MNAREVVRSANGRTIILGEHHTNRECLRIALQLMKEAHVAGYRSHGVELPRESKFDLVGLDEMVTTVKRIARRTIADRDPDGSVRENKYWHVREALRLRWKIAALDPLHYDYLKDRYFLRRDPAIFKNIPEDGMIAVLGSAHLKGMHDRFGKRVVCVTSIRFLAKDVWEHSCDMTWRKRANFSLKVPLLEYE